MIRGDGRIARALEVFYLMIISPPGALKVDSGEWCPLVMSLGGGDRKKPKSDREPKEDYASCSLKR